MGYLFAKLKEEIGSLSSTVYTEINLRWIKVLNIY